MHFCANCQHFSVFKDLYTIGIKEARQLNRMIFCHMCRNNDSNRRDDRNEGIISEHDVKKAVVDLEEQ